ncbi:NADH-quinone oxidoreductase subunit C [Hydrogenimonas sp. SS33]|uniref:NADH-quinone oxidoreductase subunit C n=1 Tax=Hydrogenimonas leucolamina TaxID=2954236 RepID=UPI00336BE2A6
MRPYTPKDNVQKKAYYTDRFWVAPRIPEDPVPEGDIYAEDVAAVKKACKVLNAYLQRGQLVIVINAKDNVAALKTLKEERGYGMLSEMSAVDFLAQRGGFEVFYQILNLKTARRIRVKCFLKEEEAIESVNPLYRSADWAEREMWDLMGVNVNNHPYLKRLIMPDDWEGHPLRKTYPLEGDEFAQWYEVDKIFGKEARDIIGPENRDPARIDRYDTERFARLGHEVPRGAPAEEVDETKTPIHYQEEEGVFLIEKMSPETSKVLDKRK